MDTDADTEPWVGTVKSIQAQSEDDDEADVSDEMEDMNEEQATTSQEEGEIDQQAEQEEMKENDEEELHNHDIVLKLDESEEEFSQEDKHDEDVSIQKDITKDTCVISNTLVTEAVVNSIDENEIDATKDKKVVEKIEVQDEPDSTTGRVTPVQHQFKTPPRPTRLSVMPPTPPESGQGTPPQQVNTLKVCNTQGFIFQKRNWA